MFGGVFSPPEKQSINGNAFANRSCTLSAVDVLTLRRKRAGGEFRAFENSVPYFVERRWFLDVYAINARGR